MGYISSDRKQQDIIGYCIDDFVEKESKCRYIVKLIDELDLTKLYQNYGNQGAESYDPKIMMAIWFLAFCEGIVSSRKIENLCKKHMDFIYISGNLRPDHSTLCRFMQRNMELWPGYFQEIVKLGKNKKISDFKEIMIDGTKIRAKSSKKKSKREKSLETYLKAVNKEIDDYKAAIQNTEISAEEKKEIEVNLKNLEYKQDQMKKCHEKLKERKQSIRAKDRETHQINIAEPDALIMDLGLGRGYQPAYNGQIAVDAKTQLIVTFEVSQDRNDMKQFEKMHSLSEDILGTDTERIYGADGGYSSFAQVKYALESKTEVYIQDPKLKGYKQESFEQLQNSGRNLNRLDFKYDQQHDCYICPKGEILRLRDKTEQGKNYEKKDCSQCPIKEQCLGKSNKYNKRTILRDQDEPYAEEMRERMQTEKGLQIMMKRQTSVEPVFGNIKENMGFRRFRMKSLKNVRSEFALICMAHNINKLFRLVWSFNNCFSLVRLVFRSFIRVINEINEGIFNNYRINGIVAIHPV
jgi:transposase